MATFLHSQPVGHSAKTRDLLLLVGPCRGDKIELEKGLARWRAPAIGWTIPTSPRRMASCPASGGWATVPT